jgi:Raf kinase inhibitor-like YbhB/YbcL family protein
MLKARIARLLLVAMTFGLVGIGGVVVAHPGHEHGTGKHDTDNKGTAKNGTEIKGTEKPIGIRTWTDARGVFELEASFVATLDDASPDKKVQLRKQDGKLLTLSLDQHSDDDQHWIEHRRYEIRKINEQRSQMIELALAPTAKPSNSKPSAVAPEIAQAFEPFAKLKAIAYRWDDRYFYVESNGIPDHKMMVGITAWQQQVPLPQKYVGDNAWQIPLNPVPAAVPATAKGRFLRGAIALAVNGIPIFNPLNNRGDDAYLFGELDEYGGHCGRADDYHYHIAPIHLEKQVGKNQIIAYALDGYPIYGYDEPDGSKVMKLDALNGHKDNEGHYHYHATKTYPYLNGGFYGEVTERDGQVDPQPRAQGVREALPPMKGAKITGFTSPKPNNYLLTYDVSGRKGTVGYTLNADGSVAFKFTEPNGKSTTETYQPRRRPPGGGGPGGPESKGPRRPGDNAPPKDGTPPKNGPPPKDGPPPPQAGTEKPSGAEQPPTTSSLSEGSQADGNFAPKLVVTSSAFQPNGEYPAEFTCDGQGISPPVEWTGAPAGTKSYALSLWHTAPDQEKSYWIVYNIPAKTTNLPKNSKKIGLLGTNDKRRNEYDPMCSKGPGKKAYNITVYALSQELKLQPNAVNRQSLLEAIKNFKLAEGTLSYQYERKVSK